MTNRYEIHSTADESLVKVVHADDVEIENGHWHFSRRVEKIVGLKSTDLKRTLYIKQPGLVDDVFLSWPVTGEHYLYKVGE